MSTSFEDFRDHFEMYPEAFGLNVEKFNPNLNFRDNFSATKIKMVYSELPFDIAYYEILSLEKTIEEIIIKTNTSGHIESILLALQMPNIQKIQVYDNTTAEHFAAILNIFIKLIELKMPVTELKIYASDISGGNGHLYQTHITIVANIEIQFVLQYIITPSNIQEIFKLCPNLLELDISENFNAEAPEYLYLFKNDIIFPNLLNTIKLDGQDNTNNIENAINEIKSLKFIYYNGGYSEHAFIDLNAMIALNTKITFIDLGV